MADPGDGRRNGVFSIALRVQFAVCPRHPLIGAEVSGLTSDNRCTMHSVEPFDNATERRVMHRVTLVGDGNPQAAGSP